MKNEQQTKHWLALLRAPGVGNRNYLKLLRQYGDPAGVFAAPRQACEELGLGAKSLSWLEAPDWRLIQGDMDWLSQPEHHLITLESPDYPPLLLEIADPPPLLFAHGDPQWLRVPQLAMVGSRNPSRGGIRSATDFARFLASNGLTITSGLAIGIDAACHQGALTARGPGSTVAVTGTGLDRVYPARHRELAHQVAKNGVLVSEFPPGTAPKAQNFPRRNRIISGLSMGTLVVEAALRSGSLITARLALEQGREVFAIPGSIHNPLAKGCHALIRQGAKLVETADDIVEELAGAMGEYRFRTGPVQCPPTSGCKVGGDTALDADYQCLLDIMGFDPVSVDTLIEHSGLTPEAVSSMLLLLELDGYVSSASGGRYCRAEKN